MIKNMMAEDGDGNEERDAGMDQGCAVVANLQSISILFLCQLVHNIYPLSRMAFTSFIMLSLLIAETLCNPDAKRLYDDLMSSYNSLIRPVGNNSDRVTVKIGLKLSQLVDVVSIESVAGVLVLTHTCILSMDQNLKDQIMATNMWVEQEWNDYNLRWDPEEYGGVKILYVPSEQIWLPDLVLYNNADGNYEITIMTKAVVHHNGTVFWNPPAIYKSACNIDIQVNG